MKKNDWRVYTFYSPHKPAHDRWQAIAQRYSWHIEFLGMKFNRNTDGLGGSGGPSGERGMGFVAWGATEEAVREDVANQVSEYMANRGAGNHAINGPYPLEATPAALSRQED